MTFREFPGARRRRAVQPVDGGHRRTLLGHGQAILAPLATSAAQAKRAAGSTAHVCVPRRHAAEMI
jgi:hypothetical protein